MAIPRSVRLRLDMTDAERLLWLTLGAKRFSPFRFHRQQPICPYIVDFYCTAARLIIELDGEQHYDVAAMVYDSPRSQWLTEQGFAVLRFNNIDVLKCHDDVLETLWRAIDARVRNLPPPHPEPSPLPLREGEIAWWLQLSIGVMPGSALAMAR